MANSSGAQRCLEAFSKPTMNKNRAILAATPKKAVRRDPTPLARKGRNLDFARSDMSDMAASAVPSGGGDTGDVV